MNGSLLVNGTGTLKCPHCLHAVIAENKITFLGQDADGYWGMAKLQCPGCHRFIVALLQGQPDRLGMHYNHARLVHPRGITRPPCPQEVVDTSPDIAEDYREACLVLADSPKASAALSRRCLQHLLTANNVKKGNLVDQIDEAIKACGIPSHIADLMHMVRHIGNFAAHPSKSVATGEIVTVEQGEAEINLEVLESLFDFFYVQPAANAKRKALFNQKLANTGKNNAPVTHYD